ncbi:MAG: archease [Nanoarchaeota archaeon]|nr:archease [Nanoarchaeota archaeon]
MKYKILDDLTSDIMFEAYGSNLKEAFESSALALFDIICKIKAVRPLKSIHIELSAENKEELMFSWLQELIARVDLEEMFFSKFEIIEVSETNLIAKIYGEPISPKKGEVLVKALTNHKYEFKKTKSGYKVTAVLDI